MSDNSLALPSFADVFQSGEWRGFYLQPSATGHRHKMEMALSFNRGAISGSGSDVVGAFSFTGRYDARTGQVNLVKQYVGLHRVHYRGWAEDGKGIYGAWTMSNPGYPAARGGFCIWPKGMFNPEAMSEQAEDETPAEELANAVSESRTSAG